MTPKIEAFRDFAQSRNGSARFEFRLDEIQNSLLCWREFLHILPTWIVFAFQDVNGFLEREGVRRVASGWFFATGRKRLIGILLEMKIELL